MHMPPSLLIISFVSIVLCQGCMTLGAAASLGAASAMITSHSATQMLLSSSNQQPQEKTQSPAPAQTAPEKTQPVSPLELISTWFKQYRTS